MVLLLAFIVSLILFDIDIAYRYQAGTSVAFYQTIGFLVLAVNAVLLLPSARWGRRLAGWLDRRGADSGAGDEGGGGAMPVVKGGAAVGVPVAVAVVGAILLMMGIWQTVPKILREPVAINGATAPLALLREAALRLDQAQSAYLKPYDMIGWKTRLSSMPWMVGYQARATSLGVDSRLIGMLAVAAIGLVGVLLAVSLAERWRRGLAGPGALAGAVLLLVAVGFFCLSRTSRTLEVREPFPVLWLVVTLFGVAAWRKRWTLAGGLLGVAVALSLPMIFLAPVFFTGVYAIKKAGRAAGPVKGEANSEAAGVEKVAGGDGGSGKEEETEGGAPGTKAVQEEKGAGGTARTEVAGTEAVPASGGGAFPSIPLVLFLVIAGLSIAPHIVELGALARGVIETPFDLARYQAETNQLGILPGLVYVLSFIGLRQLLPILFLVVIGEICNRASRVEAMGPVQLVRLLALTAFALAFLAPLPSNKAYWPYLALLLVTGGGMAMEETARPRAGGIGGTGAGARVRSGGRVVAILGLLVAVAVVGAFRVRIWNKTPEKTLSRMTSTTKWSGRSLVRSGFQPREGKQVWMDGTRGVIDLPAIERKSGNLRLKLSVVGSKTKDSNGLTVEINGMTVYSTELKTGTLNVVDVPVDGHFLVIGANTLVLRSEWADSPVNMGMGGADTRTLSFGYYGLQWKPKSSH